MERDVEQENKKWVSCITPVWNGEKYIGFLLDSILEQTYPWVEMILVDDGSKDNTLKIAESYRGKFKERGYRYEIIKASHNHASAAMNQGLKLVRGEYLIWPDSDDVLEKDSIKKRVDFLTEHPEFQSVRTLMYYFSEDGQVIEADEKIGDLENKKLFFDILESNTFVCCGCYMLKTKEFFSIYPERRIPEYPVGQNFQMLLPYMYYYTCYTIPEYLYGVRVHQDSHSRRPLTPKEEEEKFRNFEKLIDDISIICNIYRFREKRRIAHWKLRRRRYIARKYGKDKLPVTLLWYAKQILRKNNRE